MTFLFQCSGLLSFLFAITSLEFKKGWFVPFTLFSDLLEKRGRGRREDRIKGKIRKRVEKRETFWFTMIFSKILIFFWNINTEIIFFKKIPTIYIGMFYWIIFEALLWIFSFDFSIFCRLRCFKISILCIFPSDTPMNPSSLQTLRL